MRRAEKDKNDIESCDCLENQRGESGAFAGLRAFR